MSSSERSLSQSLMVLLVAGGFERGTYFTSYLAYSLLKVDPLIPNKFIAYFKLAFV